MYSETAESRAYFVRLYVGPLVRLLPSSTSHLVLLLSLPLYADHAASIRRERDMVLEGFWEIGISFHTKANSIIFG